jgi:hypothetical protein
MTEYPDVKPDSGENKMTSRLLTIFWFGFIVYSASFALSTTTSVNYIVCQLLQILGMILFLPSAMFLMRWKFDNNYLKLIFTIYCFWLLTVIFRGFVFNYGSIKFMLFDAEFGLLRYFVPLILLFPKNIVFYKKLFTVIVVLGIIFILYDLMFHNNLLDLDYTNNNSKFTFEYFVKILSLPAGFLVIAYQYQSKRRIIIAIFIIVVGAAFAILRARRALIFMTLCPLIFSYLLYLYAGKKKLLIVFSSIIIFSFLIFYGIKVYNEDKYGAFSLITDRMYENTRSSVEYSFYQDMNPKDWIIGRGINGQYFSPGIDIGDTTGFRGMIETDYLNIILKGGLISLALLVLITIPAIIKGIFFSRNLLSKAAALWILIWLIELYPANVNSFSLNHLLVWISVGICYSKSVRNTPESEVVKILSE